MPKEKRTDKKKQNSSPVDLHEKLLLKLSPQKQKHFKEQLTKFKRELRKQRTNLTLFKRPFTTIKLCIEECFVILKKVISYLFLKHILATLLILSITSTAISLRYLEGSHQPVLIYYFDRIYIATEWVILGVLSSVGLGTGLHTFVLYLGPFIAKVALAATECNSVDFDLYGKNAMLCPETGSSTGTISFWDIVGKVQFAALCWGMGTAIGELPPYFVARGARLSGKRQESVEDSDYDSDEDSTPEADQSLLTKFTEKIRPYLTYVLENHAFMTIVVLASVPNPLFDLAGITCGYSLIPFWTFFGATILGKAIIKANLQAFLVVVVFSKNVLESVISLVERYVPLLHGKVHEFFEKEKARFHPAFKKQDDGESLSPSLFKRVWDLLLFTMIAYFVISIVNSTAQTKMLNDHKAEVEEFKSTTLKALLSEQQKPPHTTKSKK